MSYDTPSGPPPSGPPPGGQAETLDSRGGDRPRGRGRRSTVLAAGAAVAVVAVGGAAWATLSFFSTGDQPAEALPASTLGYASIDLDPSGGQKIAALRALSKFPAFDDVVGLDADDDVRRWIFDEIQGETECEALDYDDDVAPWLGDRFAVAAVDAGGDLPAPVFVLQVSDDDAADAGLQAIRECAGGDSVEGAWSIRDGWALIGETQQIVDDAAADAAEASLADDDDFQHWTSEAGDSGIVSLYAAPEVGALLADELGGVGDDLGLAPEEVVPEESIELLKEFRGAAATIRFDDGGLELEMAADAGATGSMADGDAAGDLVASLPEGTVAALGLSLGDGWADELLDQIAEATGESTDELVAQASEVLGIDLPQDAETLAGSAIALAVDGDFDPESWFGGAAEPGSGIGVKILGDPDGVEDVLDKLRAAAAGQDAGFLDSDADDEAVALGPDADYRAKLLSDRGLGGTDSFERVVEHHDDAAVVLFVDFDAGDDWLVKLAGDDQDVRENLEPLEGLGMSAWLDGDTSHAVLKITTD
ncbi:DUF3352 domain-containing protein [Nocardioides sp. LMS-CY]|uniref:DUF3352 domain-containing protein n=1 Tax=Nocardioides soli TaxID=1036020 RepID=A0A7W4VR93_9ACTN|nr:MULTISPECIES: DUF3352 domain-containing protein [Nocardioides]MBB3040312.1 hypothetical protein [Nocardioides soli]QWF24196.1 DUF3352 domain-containing protein [Nocardioides sp. LMS-CY]